MRSYRLRGRRVCHRCSKIMPEGHLAFDTLDPAFAGVVWCSVECCSESLDESCREPAAVDVRAYTILAVVMLPPGVYRRGIDALTQDVAAVLETWRATQGTVHASPVAFVQIVEGISAAASEAGAETDA